MTLHKILPGQLLKVKSSFYAIVLLNGHPQRLSIRSPILIITSEKYNDQNTIVTYLCRGQIYKQIFFKIDDWLERV